MSSINKLVSTDLRTEQSKVIEEVVSLEVSKLNHSVMNKKIRRSNAVFCRKKTVKTRKWIHPSYQLA